MYDSLNCYLTLKSHYNDASPPPAPSPPPNQVLLNSTQMYPWLGKPSDDAWLSFVFPLTAYILHCLCIASYWHKCVLPLPLLQSLLMFHKCNLLLLYPSLLCLSPPVSLAKILPLAAFLVPLHLSLPIPVIHPM